MNFGDVIKGIGGFICAVTVSSMEHLNEHNKKVNAYKDEFRKRNVSIEELKSIVKREIVDKKSLLSAKGQAAAAILKEKGVIIQER